MKIWNLILSLFIILGSNSFAKISTVSAQIITGNSPSSQLKEEDLSGKIGSRPINEDLTNRQEYPGNSSLTTYNRFSSQPLPQAIPNHIIPDCELPEPEGETFTNVADLETNLNPNTQALSSNKDPTCVAREDGDNTLPNYPLVSQLNQPGNSGEARGNNQELAVNFNYISPPKIISDQKLHPFITTIALNGRMINHLTQQQINSYSLGENPDRNYSINATYRISSQVEQSLSKDNIFTSDQRGSYLQLQTVRTENEVKLTQANPETMQGMTMQMTFTGSCLGNTNRVTVPNSQCTFTPSLVTDRNAIDPQFLVPTRIEQLGNMGSPVSPETVAILAKPGFQNVGANGQVVGLDLYFPNLGSIPGNSETNQSTITRTEDSQRDYLLSFSRVRQILKANDTQAVIGRTIRGTGLLLNDGNTLLNTAVALASEFLPDANPQLEGSTNPVNTNINRNLFNAANNTWLPGNSWTVYQAGIGMANHAQPTTEGKNTLPSARFNNIWIGFSPVIERSRSLEFAYQPTGPEQPLILAGGEGGQNENLGFVSNTNGVETNSNSLRNFYTQIYLSFFTRNVNFLITDKITEETSYYPHISLSGNITNTNQVFRYYGGIVASSPMKAYIGGDYTRSANNWTFNISGVGYLNPDRDYYSRVQGNLSHRLDISNNSNIILFTGFRYSFVQNTDPLNKPSDNFFSVGARANLGDFSLGLTQYFDSILPNSINTALGIDASLRLGLQGRISAYLSPTNSQLSYGLTAEYKFSQDRNSPLLIVGWSRDVYDYGLDPFGNQLDLKNDTFSILFRLGSLSR
ncbi:MAG TPA: hypothetical protein DEG17_21470 [Cyanobacteria bacterium UBA11149]|nr:hypothetical protein [Cyanobacteria bacterium UBA11367]HBE60700.1 hypothetical protein [Cyanobacteria bacterium UBA11366]HBK66446.1 hypothetical protein [Cyanobacteria bacterium UBA11166]HBR74502.1 hypothetical protein [Cyanobacteria bacterium UBA11159]HBS68300.1 hypothetical protein [Cyanobacteria bacterium UBA11153]HBW91359.1 hypothetical protein [Cyanobacteria bacterium UBA11149]HCA93606.1 hypothetical protein [Cyanobacteria bacterium UBA9226]